MRPGGPDRQHITPPNAERDARPPRRITRVTTFGIEIIELNQSTDTTRHDQQTQ